MNRKNDFSIYIEIYVELLKKKIVDSKEIHAVRKKSLFQNRYSKVHFIRLVQFLWNEKFWLKQCSLLFNTRKYTNHANNQKYDLIKFSC